MTTHHTDEKKPASGGFWKKRELEKPRFRLFKGVYWACEGMGVREGGYDPGDVYLSWRARVGPLSIGERLRALFVPWTLSWSFWNHYQGFSY